MYKYNKRTKYAANLSELRFLVTSLYEVRLFFSRTTLLIAQSFYFCSFFLFHPSLLQFLLSPSLSIHRFFFRFCLLFIHSFHTLAHFFFHTVYTASFVMHSVCSWNIMEVLFVHSLFYKRWLERANERKMKVNRQCYGHIIFHAHAH